MLAGGGQAWPYRGDLTEHNSTILVWGNEDLPFWLWGPCLHACLWLTTWMAAVFSLRLSIGRHWDMHSSCSHYRPLSLSTSCSHTSFWPIRVVGFLYCAFHISCPCSRSRERVIQFLCILIGCEVVKVTLSLFKHFQWLLDNWCEKHNTEVCRLVEEEWSWVYTSVTKLSIVLWLSV
jgi:hypothetical protein